MRLDFTFIFSTIAVAAVIEHISIDSSVVHDRPEIRDFREHSLQEVPHSGILVRRGNEDWSSPSKKVTTNNKIWNYVLGSKKGTTSEDTTETDIAPKAKTKPSPMATQVDFNYVQSTLKAALSEMSEIEGQLEFAAERTQESIYTRNQLRNFVRIPKNLLAHMVMYMGYLEWPGTLNFFWLSKLKDDVSMAITQAEKILAPTTEIQIGMENHYQYAKEYIERLLGDGKKITEDLHSIDTVGSNCDSLRKRVSRLKKELSQFTSFIGVFDWSSRTDINHIIDMERELAVYISCAEQILGPNPPSIPLQH